MKWCVYTRSSSSKWQNEIKQKIKEKRGWWWWGGSCVEWGFATSTQNSWIDRQLSLFYTLGKEIK
jgi:hypothetical protein